MYSTPTVALVPLMIIWLGVGIWDKVVIVFLGAFFQIAISVSAGPRLADPRLLRVSQSYGASRWRIFRTVLLPTTVPFILVGLRLGVLRALVGVVVAEFVAATAGLGFLISAAGAHFQTARVFVGIILIASLGVAATSGVRVLERRVERWRPRVGSA
jgi:NitT/TauT family transport system permease protein